MRTKHWKPWHKLWDLSISYPHLQVQSEEGWWSLGDRQSGGVTGHWFGLPKEFEIKRIMNQRWSKTPNEDRYMKGKGRNKWTFEVVIMEEAANADEKDLTVVKGFGQEPKNEP